MWNKVPKREYIKGNGYAPKKNPDKIINDGVIYDPMGQWKYPGEVTKIPGNTMATHGYGNIPLWVVPDNDPARLVQPNSGQQLFPNSTNFTEYPQLPIAQRGGVLLPGAQGRWLDSVNAQFNKQYGGDMSIPDLNQMKKGGWLEGYSKQTRLRGERGYTSKNIKTSINKLMLRNETLFGPKGKRIYDPLSKFQEGGWEQSISKFLGNPMSKAAKAADYKRPVVDPKTRRQHEAEPVDNVRHASAGRYTAEAIKDYAKLIPFLNNIPGLAEAAGFVGSNALGLGHEISSLYNDNQFDTRPWGLKLKETAADAYNNMVGSRIGLSNLSPYEKEAYIKYLSETGKMPTGQYNKKKDPTYKKQMGGEGWLEQYQTAGQTTAKNYYPTSPEDYTKRKQMYNDSLAIANPGINLLRKARSKEVNGMIPYVTWAPISDEYGKVDISKPYARLTAANRKEPVGKYNDIHASDPTGIYTGSYGITTYKKPTQKVYPYQAPAPIVNNTPMEQVQVKENKWGNMPYENTSYLLPESKPVSKGHFDMNKLAQKYYIDDKGKKTWLTESEYEQKRVPKKALGGWLNQYQEGGEEFFKSLPKTDPNRKQITIDDYNRATVSKAKKSLIDKGITHNWEQAPGYGYTVPEHPINSNKITKQQDGGSTYKIKAGDSLSKIAKKYQTTVAELQKVNKIKNANLIVAGKSLIVPKPPSVDKELIPPVNNPTDVIRPTTNQKLDEQLPLTPVGVMPGVDIEEQKTFYNVPADTFKPDTVYSSYLKQQTGDKDIPYVYTLGSSIPELTTPTFAGSHTDDKWGADNLGINTEGTIEKLKIQARTQGPNIYRESGDKCIGADGSTVTECTSGMQLALDYNTAVKGEDRKKLGITGDAWEIGENIVEAGGNRYYNLTDIDFDRNNLKTNKDVKNYLDENKKKLKLNNKAIAEQAEVGDIVEMWYQGSPSQDKALNRGKGKTVTTHAGIITEKDGKKYVSHNVHGVWHSDPLEKSLDKRRLNHGGSSIMIAGLVRPDYSDNKTALETIGIQVNPNAKFYSKEDESSYRNTKEAKWKTETPVGKESQEFNKGLAYYAPKVQQDFGLTDKETEQLMKLTFGLFGKESGFGKGQKYVKKEKRRKFIKAYKDVAPDWAPEGDEMSAGKTQIKVDTVFDTPEKKALLAKYGITKDNIWDTENSAAAGLLSAAINYKKFKDFSGATYDNMDPLTLQNILALAHNKGMDAVIKNEFTERDKRTVGEKVGKLLKGQSDWKNNWDVEPYANIETKLKGFDTYSKLHLDSESYSNLVADYAASLNVDYNKIKLIHEDPNNFVTRTDINPNTIIDDQIEADIKKARYLQGAVDDKVDKAKSYVKKGKKVLKKGVRKTRQLVQRPKAWLNKYI